MSVRDELHYTEDHEWILLDGDVATIGITEHAQDQLGDVVFVELPQVGASFSTGEGFGTVESVKAVSDLFSPLAGEVLEVNAKLSDTPELVNASPFDDAWMVKLKVSNPAEIEEMLDAEAYRALLDA